MRTEQARVCERRRDLKPENCVIETATMTVKVIDFGLAKHLESAATLGIGTPVRSKSCQFNAYVVLQHLPRET